MGLLACLIVIGVLAISGQALAGQHGRKPHKLWNQYPLKVHNSAQGKNHQSPAPSRSAATPSPASSPDAATKVSKDAVDPHSRGSTSGGKVLVLGGGVVLLAALFFAIKRANPHISGNTPEHAPIPPRLQRTESGDDVGREGSRNSNQEVAEPAVEPGGSRVRVQLEDGRSLEGFTRESGSTDAELVILNVVAAFDAKGNDVPRRPSDSFILRSEIASMQRLDDP